MKEGPAPLASIQKAARSMGARSVTTRTSSKATSGIVAHVVFLTHLQAAYFARHQAWALVGRPCFIRRIGRANRQPVFYVSVPAKVVN